MEYARVVIWLVAYAVLAGAGLPIAARLFPWLAGRGAGFALPVSLGVLTIAAYWVGQVSLAVAPAVGMLALLLLAATAALDWGVIREQGTAAFEGGPPTAVEIDRGAVSDTAVVFVLGFLLLVAVRAVDPAVYPAGGEKFLDFGLLKSLERARALPPVDMWFAGEPVRYYYGGHLMASLLARLTATPPRFAYNLALAGFYGMLVAAAFELAGAVGVNRGVPRRVAGAFAAFFVGFASNLLTAGRLVLGALPADLQRMVASRIASRTADLTVDRLLSSLDQFSYWTAHLVIPGTNNEFPLFAWINGDLQSHMIGLPFLLLAAGLAYSYYRTPERARWQRRFLVFGAMPLLVGLQTVVVTWSTPVLLGLLWLTLALSPADPLTLFPRGIAERVRERVGVAAVYLSGRNTGRVRAEVVRPVVAALTVGAVGAIALVVAAPYLPHTPESSGVAVLPPDARSSLGGLVVVHGAFLAAFVAYLFARLRPERPEYLLVALVALGGTALGIGAPVLLLAVPLVVGGWIALRLDRPAGFETLLIVAGAGLVTIVEFVYVVEQAGPLRYNTVFKTYIQVWVLWGTAAGVVVPGLLADPERVPAVLGRSAGTAADGGDGVRKVARAWPTRSGVTGTLAAVLVVVLVLSTSIYGGLALSTHFERTSGPATLDATAFVERDHPEYAGAIDYVDDRRGQPTLLSAPATARCLDLGDEYPCGPGMYDWHSSPAASLTGVPTVAGWAHEVGYRGAETYYRRARHVDAIYTGSTETRVRLLRQYGVDYIWVGGAERNRYGEVAFGNVSGIEPAYEGEAVTVYRVNEEELPG